jgi:hypothetical protein
MRHILSATAAALILATPVVAKEAPIARGGPVAAKSLAIRFSPLYERVAQADCIVIGKVTGLEKKTVAARPFPSAPQKNEYQVATVKISESLVGAKGLTDLRVGFIAPARADILPQPADGGGGPVRPAIRIRPPYYQPRLTVGQEGLFFLGKHSEEDFYVLSGYQSVISKQDGETFKKELAQVKHCFKLLEKPTASLKAKDASDRLLTAAMLVSRFRHFKPGMTYPPKTQPVDARRSKLILSVLAEADWSQMDQQNRLSPVMVFSQLGLTDKDGWTPPRVTQDYAREMAAAFKDWYQKHGDTYRIQRIVEEKPARK